VEGAAIEGARPWGGAGCGCSALCQAIKLLSPRSHAAEKRWPSGGPTCRAGLQAARQALSVCASKLKLNAAADAHTHMLTVGAPTFQRPFSLSLS
jgi:hypothetical protein